MIVQKDRRVVHRVKTSGTTSENEWQRVQTNDNEWQRETTSDNIISANFSFFQIRKELNH